MPVFKQGMNMTVGKVARKNTGKSQEEKAVWINKKKPAKRRHHHRRRDPMETEINGQTTSITQ